jgi:hypothetical protein
LQDIEIKVTNFKIDAAKLKTFAETPEHFAELELPVTVLPV